MPALGHEEERRRQAAQRQIGEAAYPVSAGAAGADPGPDPDQQAADQVDRQG